MRLPLLLLITIITLGCSKNGEIHWEPAENPLFTKWVEDVDPQDPWPEYPRPQLKRDQWQNLNGLWEYSITQGGEPEEFDGHILVPYPIESALSGVKLRLEPDQTLWYKRNVEIDPELSGNQLHLNFEAVDWECTVWIDGQRVGEHRGGYDPFSFDITNYVGDDASFEILVSVKDPTDTGSQPRGKQVRDPEGIWYTPTSGIWQTVWLESTEGSYISDLQIIPSLDSSWVHITPEVVNGQDTDELRISLVRDGESIASSFASPGVTQTIIIPDPRVWSPQDPFLYDLNLQLIKSGDTVDVVESYFGLRKVSLGKDENNITRIFLNNELVFQNGPLDQGFWPEGLYTAPTDEALKYDIEITKKLGFNMLRKHVKIEPRRFYYWCDKIGIWVWQDMPNGGAHIGREDPDYERPAESAEQFEKELTKLIRTKFNHPSIIMWVPFNEGWGQYRSQYIVNFIRKLDPTRLINNASGWTDRGFGDVLDLHNYPEPVPVQPEEDRAAVLGEFGGLGLKVPDHTWTQENWGYQKMVDNEQLMLQYEKFYTKVYEYKADPGLSAVVYTQTTDVETETNGLMTYDREIKVDVDHLYNINTQNYVPSPDIIPDGGLVGEVSAVVIESPDSLQVRYTTDGSPPDQNSVLYTDTIAIDKEVIIRAQAFSTDGRKSQINSATFKISSVSSN